MSKVQMGASSCAAARTRAPTEPPPGFQSVAMGLQGIGVSYAMLGSPFRESRVMCGTQSRTPLSKLRPCHRDDELLDCILPGWYTAPGATTLSICP